MINRQFEAYKISREIKRSGTRYTFERAEKNTLHEPAGDPIPVGSICGLYHETSSSVKATSDGNVSYRSRKVPMLLCSYDDWKRLGLCINDEVTVNSKRHKVLGAVNVQEWNVCVDITLEAIDEGNVQV